MKRTARVFGYALAVACAACAVLPVSAKTGSRATTRKAQSTSSSPSSSSAKTTTSTARKPAAKRRRKTSKKFTPKQLAPTADRITEIQTALAHGGYYQGDPSGKWDSGTVAAMQKFQSSSGIEPTGKIDAPTLQKLGLGSDIAGVSAPRPVAPPTAAPTSSTVPSSPVAPSASSNAPTTAAIAPNTAALAGKSAQ